MSMDAAMEKRKAYRIQPDGGRAVGIRIFRPGAGFIAGSIQNISIEGCAAVFSGELSGFMDESSIQRIFLEDVKTGERILADARYLGEAQRNGETVFRFAFLGRDRLVEGLDLSVWRELNRRMSFRVAPDPVRPVFAKAFWEMGSVAGRVCDISPHGMGFFVPEDSSPLPDPPGRFLLTFVLEGCDESIGVEAGQSHVMKMQDGMLYGLSFVWIPPVSFNPARAAIAAYVLRRKEENGALPS